MHRYVIYKRNSGDRIDYQFFVAARSSPRAMKRRNNDRYEHVATVKIPPGHQKQLEAMGLFDREYYSFGNIEYAIRQTPRIKLASSEVYFPKPTGVDKRGDLPGLGYLLEYFCTRDLKECEGVTHVSSSLKPDIPRQKQLQRAGLPIRDYRGIEDWIQKIGAAAATRISSSTQ